MSGYQFIDEAKELSGEADNEALAGLEQVEPDKVEASPEEPVETPESSENETPPKEADSSKQIDVREDGSVLIGKTEFKSVEDALESIPNLQALYGRQSQELGELRKMKSSYEEKSFNEPERSEPEPEAMEYDVYDPDSVRNLVNETAKKQASAIVQRVLAEQEQKSSFMNTVSQLKEKNPAITDEQWMEIARFGDENGISNIKHAFIVFQNENTVKEAKTSGRKEALNDLKKVSEVPKTLSNAKGVSGNEKIDFDNLTQDEWAKLPDDVRMKALQEA